MVTPVFDVDDKEFTQALNELQKRMKDMRPVFGSIRDDWYKNNRTIFTLKSPGKYQDLSTAYKARKEKEAGFIYPILKAKNGRIESGLTDKNSQYTVNEMTKNSLTLGVQNIVYARRHQIGARMPKRPFVFNAKTGGPIYELQLKRWKDIVTTTLKRRIAAQGRPKA